VRSLLDVNVLIALFDPDHLFHDRAHTWWKSEKQSGWASCAITENGLLRILSNPKYSPERPFSPHELLQRLNLFVQASDHQFLTNSISFRDQTVFSLGPLCRSQELTDVFLLGLAVTKDCRLVTFDKGINRSHVSIAEPKHLLVLS
jgi:toxin-antitoxin system PIN domain toxin